MQRFNPAALIPAAIVALASQAAAQLAPDWIERYASPDGRKDEAIAVVVDDAGNSFGTRVLFLNAYKVGDPDADFSSDGTVNTLDFLAFLSAFSAGCN